VAVNCWVLPLTIIDGFHDRLDGYSSTTAVGLDSGVGMLWDVGRGTAPTAWRLRVEAKYQREFSDHTAAAASVGDIVYRIGGPYRFTRR
jgi:hypothetical protein